MIHKFSLTTVGLTLSVMTTMTTAIQQPLENTTSSFSPQTSLVILDASNSSVNIKIPTQEAIVGDYCLYRIDKGESNYCQLGGLVDTGLDIAPHEIKSLQIFVPSTTDNLSVDLEITPIVEGMLLEHRMINVSFSYTTDKSLSRGDLECNVDAMTDKSLSYTVHQLPYTCIVTLTN